jgi:chemotaxis signal transduction protein
VERVHVQLRVGAERYALPVEHVVEVTASGETTALPGSRPGLLTLRVLRGRVLPVYDLAAVLEIERGEAPQWLVVVAEGGRRAGLAVHEVSDVEPLPEPLPADSLLLVGSVLCREHLVGVINTACLFDELQRLSAA